MLEMGKERVYPLVNNNGNIQGTLTTGDSLADGVRARIEIVGQIDKNREAALAEELEQLVKKFYS